MDKTRIPLPLVHAHVHLSHRIFDNEKYVRKYNGSVRAPAVYVQLCIVGNRAHDRLCRGWRVGGLRTANIFISLPIYIETNSSRAVPQAHILLYRRQENSSSSRSLCFVYVILAIERFRLLSKFPYGIDSG